MIRGHKFCEHVPRGHKMKFPVSRGHKYAPHLHNAMNRAKDRLRSEMTKGLNNNPHLVGAAKRYGMSKIKRKLGY